MIPKPIEVKAVAPDCIWLKFEDGSQGSVCLLDLIVEPLFSDLKDFAFFNQVYITDNSTAIAWNEDLELCANSLYLEIQGLSFEQWKNKELEHASN